jgi:hypothetical protein
MNTPFIIKLTVEDSNIDLINEDIKFSTNTCLPLCSLGYQNFLVRTKNYMNITKNFDTDNDFYYVVNPYEISITNSDESLKDLIKQYLIEDIYIDITFFKIWEILFIFDILKKEECVYALFSNNTNGIIQSIINYKKYFKLDFSKDKIYNVSEEKNLISSKNIINHRGKNEITNMKIINSFLKEIDKTNRKADVIIADCGFETYNSIEPEMYNILLSEIIMALKCQNINGNFILKVFETFTLPTIKIIYFICELYESVHIYKPYYSRPTLSEKYIIFKNFKNNSNLYSKIHFLEEILLKINESKLNMYDIWSDLKLSQEYINKFTYINTKIANAQQIMINDIINYIKDNNYFGDKYHMYKEKQINATKLWIDIFILNKEQFDINKYINMYDAYYNNFIANLVKVI